MGASVPTRMLKEEPAPTTTTTVAVAPSTTTTEATPARDPAPKGAGERAAPPRPGRCGGWAEEVAARWPADQVGKACSVLVCESGGDPQAQNAHSSASGLFQFLRSTWAGRGGYAEAWLAPPSLQLDAALDLWASSGWSQWSCA